MGQLLAIVYIFVVIVAKPDFGDMSYRNLQEARSQL